jgi:hypothetical protein
MFIFFVCSGGCNYYRYCHTFHVPRLIITTTIINWKVRGSNTGGGQIFRTRPDRHGGAQLASYTMLTGSYVGVKRTVRGVEQIPLIYSRG